jgi:hypothetical protein
MQQAVFTKFLLGFALSIFLFGCGGSESSLNDNSNNNNNDTSNGGATDVTTPSPPTQTQSLSVVMASPNADLSQAQPLEGASLESKPYYFFFREGTDWADKNISRIDFYCCKGGTNQHVRFPSDTVSPYVIHVDLSQYEPGILRELYADVFIVGQYAPVEYYVNFTTTRTNTAPPPDPPLPPVINNPPVISGFPATSIVATETFSFSPSASDPDGDALSFSIANLPSWANFNSSNGTLSGTPANADAGIYENIVISVTDGSATRSLSAFSIEVIAAQTFGSISLSWTPPTEYTNNTPLTDLAGYKIYYGSTIGYYPNQIHVTNPGLTAYVIDNLPGNSTYYLVMTSFDGAGRESDYSNVVSRTLP